MNEADFSPSDWLACSGSKQATAHTIWYLNRASEAQAFVTYSLCTAHVLMIPPVCTRPQAKESPLRLFRLLQSPAARGTVNNGDDHLFAGEVVRYFYWAGPYVSGIVNSPHGRRRRVGRFLQRFFSMFLFIKKNR